MMNSRPNSPRPLLFPQTMGRVDARTIAGGVSGLVLMERAGAAVVSVIRGRWTRRPVIILAGPGNNGGDGWVIARQLETLGWPVSVYTEWPQDKLTGDAKAAADRFAGGHKPLKAARFSSEALIVDALFGAGLDRDLEGEVAACLTRARENGADVVAVDLPSGLCGATGEVLGCALKAEATVSFGAAKPGHLLGQGRTLSGELHIFDIGLDLQLTDADALWNSPALWEDELPYPPHAAHKYVRGGVLVVGGARHQGGAARLAAHAAAVTGAGAVTVAASPSAADIYAASLDAIMVRMIKTPEDLKELITSPKIHAIVIGPGLGTDDYAARLLTAAMEANKPLVLDADSLTLLAGRNEDWADIPDGSVLTPHEGEFARLFPEVSGSSLERAEKATQRIGRTVLLKGATTVISSTDKLSIINTHASPFLATAGSGDVLSGIISALLAQGISPFEATSAGAYIHGEAAQITGAGLTADSLWRSVGNAIHSIGMRADK